MFYFLYYMTIIYTFMLPIYICTYIQIRFSLQKNRRMRLHLNYIKETDPPFDYICIYKSLRDQKESLQCFFPRQKVFRYSFFVGKPDRYRIEKRLFISFTLVNISIEIAENVHARRSHDRSSTYTLLQFKFQTMPFKFERKTRHAGSRLLIGQPAAVNFVSINNEPITIGKNHVSRAVRNNRQPSRFRYVMAFITLTPTDCQDSMPSFLYVSRSTVTNRPSTLEQSSSMQCNLAPHSQWLWSSWRQYLICRQVVR